MPKKKKKKKTEQLVPRIRKLNINKIRPLLKMAVEEDYGKGDPTSLLAVSERKRAKEYIVTREEIIVSGMDVVREVLKMYDPRLNLHVLVEDGRRADVAEPLAIVEGPLRPMHSAERVILNFLQRLCGISTLTWKFVSAIRGTRAKIYDTRKTVPGWRELEKYAVRCGGGCNHRMNLGEMVMFKDNHLADLGERFEAKLRQLVQQARQMPGVKSVIVEVDHVDDQLDRVLPIPGIDIILLDNMGQWQLKHAVKMRNKMCGRRPLLEASGGVTLNNVHSIASCGVDRIAVGAITHSATAADIGMDR